MKILKWLERQDIIYFFIFGLVFIVYVYQSDIGTMNKSIITILFIPLFLEFIKKIIEYKIKSIDSEIDIRGIDATENCIIWKEDDKATYRHYINIRNAGKVVVQKVLVKVNRKYNSGEYNFEINAPIYPADKVMVGIPFDFDEIKEIWVSGYLQYEKITKQFYGDISECEGQYIWAEEKYYYGEKYCLKHKEKEEAKYVRLKKYWYQVNR